MITRIKNWWNKDKIEFNARMELVENLVTEQKAALEQATAELKQANEELELFRKKEEKNKDRYTSIEPWIEITSDRIDPIKGLCITCDWNDAFIQFLKDNGFNTKDENAAVQRYIASLYADICTQMELSGIEESDKKPKVSDYA